MRWKYGIYNIFKMSFKQDFFPDTLILSILIYIFSNQNKYYKVIIIDYIYTKKSLIIYLFLCGFS